MQKEINFYQEMASEHRLQEYSKGPVPLFSFKYVFIVLFEKKTDAIHINILFETKT